MKVPKQNQLEQIRKKCLDCSGFQTGEVRFCPVTECALWYLRFGCGTEVLGKNYGDLADPSNFVEGGKFASDKIASDCVQVNEGPKG